ncbi:MAG: M23 family metallopeptidase [candidate division Zixibacteria bacterium]|nr:M23 family metallopeptidase [candidate division Zixibacteria bacterium]
MLKRYLLLFTLSVFCGACFGLLTTFAKVEDFNYFWPTEKSRKVSSVFADHRSFRFHSGIDIRTDGKIGHKVFACESGYAYRLFTSYWGYGKAVYLKLDDGRYAVYGHLSNFAKKISQLVETEQMEKKRYFTDFLLEKDKLRVSKGELIGYSGQTGSGGPHLHFEIRDEENHPINPLTSGFSIKDKRPPVMKYLAIRPQDIWSKVNGQTTTRLGGSGDPLIFPCRYDRRKKVYTLDKIPMIEGKVGLELSVFDKMDKSRFKFGVLGIQLFLDGNLIFASHYGTLCYDNTQKIELDRDFELRRKKGKEFYKLYLDEGNDLLLYNPSGGIIDTKSSRPDSHQVKIIAYDANRNSSTLVFHLLFDQSPLIFSCQIEEGKDNFKMKTEFDDADDLVEKIIFEKSSSGKISWRKFSEVKVDKAEGRHTLIWSEDINKPTLVRVKVKDTFGASSDYKYLLLNRDKIKTLESLEERGKTKLDFEYSFKDNFFVFALNFSQILKEEPEIMLKSGDFDFDPFLLEQIDEKSYWAVFPFYLKEPKQMTLLVRGQDIYDDSVRFEYVIPISIVTKSHGGETKSKDGKAEVKVDPGIVYKDINLSIKSREAGSFGKEKMNIGSKHKVVGEIYSFEPSTVPLNGFAKISLEYTEGDCDPPKLGLYELAEEGWWKPIGQDLDTINKTVSGEVRYFSTYALLEDTTPPVIKKVYPYNGKKLKQRKPKINAVVGDDLSGIGSDLDIQITIDGEWMIPEYDPETNVLFTRPTFPLSYGKHELVISVKDRVGNRGEVRRNFFMVR